MTTLTAHGVRESVEIKGDFHKFKVNTGGNYPLVLSTKKKSLIDEAMGFRADEILEWVYTEKQSENINPNTQKPYVNRWLEEVHAATSSERAALPTSPVVGEGAAASDVAGVRHSARSVDVRGESIERQVIIKAAFPAYVDKFVNTDADFWKACDAAAAWLKNTPARYETLDEVPFG